ncbi:MAG: (E)-4-hydroxy-3-methylbut-2-enyl-diphosphate synthase [bacterium]|nr:(E)-4-hydroxy-3-methylbut-2-enyl-diphosphate synthase [bacterium]
MSIPVRKTREVSIGTVKIGASNKIAVQSMCATKTQNIEATIQQIKLLEEHGADLIRIAIDSKKDVEALSEIRKHTKANLVIDLQENYRLIELVAPFVQKVRYNPGHLHHHEKQVPVKDKVKFLVAAAKKHNIALRIGVNFGSLDPNLKELSASDMEAALTSASNHVGYLEELGFYNFVLSLKSSDPNEVIEINKRFSAMHPLVPLHLGVTEAGMLPMGEIKTRVAYENLLPLGIGDTVRVSLTLPFAEKFKEILVAQKIIADIESGKFRSVPKFIQEGLNIISCPSCSRVENEAFIELAQNVKEMSKYAAKENLTIAVMGCRVNGPGETDDADLGLWCAPNHVNLKRKGELIGAFSYEEILPRVKAELDQLIADIASISTSDAKPTR